MTTLSTLTDSESRQATGLSGAPPGGMPLRPPGDAFSGAVGRVLHRLPVLAAVVISFIQIATLAGVHQWDTLVFVGHTLANPYPLLPNSAPPSYPLLLDAVFVLAPPQARMFLLVLVQHATVIANVAMVLGIGRMLGRPWVGWFAAWLTALHLPFGLLAQTAQTETLFIFYCVACTFLLVKGLLANSAWLLLGSGVVAGLAGGQRTIGLALPAIVLLAIWISRGRGRLKATACLLVGFTLVIGAFVFFNYHRVGRASLVYGRGIHLFSRVAAVDRWMPDTHEARILWRLAKDGGHESPFYWNAGWGLISPLVHELGYSHEEADAILARAALQTFRAKPFRAAWNTVVAMRGIAGKADIFENLLWRSLTLEGYRRNHALIYAPLKEDPEAELDDVLLRPYPPPMNLGEWPVDLFEKWGHLAVIWRGDKCLIAMVLAALVGLLLRNRFVLLFSGLALGLVVVAAVAVLPMIRYFEPSVVFFFIAICLATAEAWRWLRERKRARAEAGGIVQVSREALGQPIR